jgi:hypothetical protein
MAMNVRLFAFFGLSLFGLVACGSSQKASGPPEPFPVVKPDIGQIVNHGGALLTSAKLVTVTWTVDQNEAALEDFGDKLVTSSYWKTVVGDYVGPGTSGPSNHVRIMTAPPATMEVKDFETWFVQQVGNAPGNGWPAWDAQTVYVVYAPTAMKLTAQGVDLCQSRANLHGEVDVAGNPHVTYVLIDENCNGSLSVLDGATSAGSHEILEGVTNPHNFSDTALIGFDASHLAWAMFDGTQDDEIGDACEIYSDAFFDGPSDLPYKLQRMWSNSSAAAGHSPCVPQSTEPYFNVTAEAMTMLNVVPPGMATPIMALGYEVPVGSTKTFEVTYYSDAATGYWDTKAFEGNGITTPSSTYMTLAVAKGAGLNGDKDQITVTVNSAPPSGNALLVTLVSTAGAHTPHYMPVLIGAY